jgi:predicted lipoprotein
VNGRGAITAGRVSTLLVLATFLVACRAPTTREQALSGLVTGVVLPSYERLEARAAALTLATRDFERVPDERHLVAAKQAWREVLIALKQTYAFRTGPIEDLHLHLRVGYWPVRPASIEALARGPLDSRSVASAGAASKGLYALEHLLYQGEAGASARRVLVRLLAEDVESSVRQMRQLAIAQDLSGTVAHTGSQGLGRAANDLIETVETIVAGRFDFAASRPAGARLEGEASGTSLAATQALLDGVGLHYLGPPGGGGLAALVGAASPAVDRSIRDALEAARAALAGLDAPLETLARSQPRRLTAARAACHRLEVELKTGLVNVLGVSLLFRSVDGD